MSGLKHIFLRILPIITLVCFISFGIIQIFNNENLTYMTVQYYNPSNGIIYENPTQEQKESANKFYTLDMVNYTQNIDQDILKRSIEKTVDLNAYSWTIQQFNKIWEDGYQIFDVTKTIANGVIMTINTVILPINIFLVPLRVMSGILLTGISLIGININNSQIIAPFLTFIIDDFAIPFIQVQNTTNYQFYENINEHYIGNTTINVEFQCGEATYDKIKIEQYSGSHVRLSYHTKGQNDSQEHWANVFDSGRTGNAWWQGHYSTYSKLNINTMYSLPQEVQQFFTNYGTFQ